MSISNGSYFFALALFAGMNTAIADQEPPAWITEGPYVDEALYAIELPVETIANKLYVEVVIGGEPKRLVFDTGSPSMISRELAAELGLDAVDSVQGRDSHGAVLRSDIVQTDLTLDGITFHRVPIFAADFSSSRAAQCILADGVLGSEILPLCSLQIDLADSAIRCNSSLDGLDHIADAAKQPLYDFGYPHAPFFDVRFAKKAVSKVMFDTGSPGLFTISPPDYEGANRARGVGRTIEGYGSLGASLGGQAPADEQRRAELPTLTVGNVDFGRVIATVRESPPSLLGASVVDQFVVTLDPESGSAYFHEYRDTPIERGEFGFSLAFGDEISVALVWEGSVADAAGIRAGQRIEAINGVPTDTSCDGIERSLLAMEKDTIEIELRGRTVTLDRAN
ncbi:MAG: aspartyl protease family protein [Woeseiaceae bacterium]|nr:aspartyl protease family protein [Woeseiaceae bacterium]